MTVEPTRRQSDRNPRGGHHPPRPLRSTSWSVLLLASLLLSQIPAQAQSLTPGPATPRSATVSGFVRAVDGESLDASVNGARTAIRLVGIEAPQGNTPCGRVAAGALQTLVGAGVQLTDDPSVAADTRRPVRRPFDALTSDGRSVAEELVGAGHVKAKAEGQRQGRLAQLEAEARNAKRGCLWGSGTSAET